MIETLRLRLTLWNAVRIPVQRDRRFRLNATPDSGECDTPSTGFQM
ncbi:hypothetical protein JYT23_00680 [Mariprofundus ferrooxydans]|nr:hypothetical protein [Mariprofundus ferrooxydans]